MPRDYGDPLYMRFLKESYEKENERRIFWFLNNETNLKTTNISEKHKGYTKETILKNSIEKSMKILSIQHSTNARARKKKLSHPWQTHKVTLKNQTESKHIKQNEESNLIMKPIEPNQMNKCPQERYNDVQTINSMYGWDQNSKLITISSRYGRFHTISGKTRTGPQPDPKHYTTPENNYSKCRWKKY